MPVMDGYKTTDAIRRWEMEKGRNPAPVIALTGHALKGKAQESLDAGCTAHISKPFTKHQLFEALRRYGPSTPHEPPEPAPAPSDTDPATDPTAPVESCFVTVDAEMAELIPPFLDNTRQEIIELAAAVASADREGVRRMGHRIKGACLCYGFDEMGMVAADIESAAESGVDMALIGDQHDRLKTLLETTEIRYG
jgi:HPt (histidine-containing phosphotransfer) domain-containing protein